MINMKRCLVLAGVLMWSTPVWASYVSHNVSFSGSAQTFNLDLTGSASLTIEGQGSAKADGGIFGTWWVDFDVDRQTRNFGLDPDTVSFLSHPVGSATVSFEDRDLTEGGMSDLNLDIRNGSDWSFGLDDLRYTVTVDLGILGSVDLDVDFYSSASITSFGFDGSGSSADVLYLGGSWPALGYVAFQPGTLSASMDGGVTAVVRAGIFGNFDLGEVASFDETASESSSLPGLLDFRALDGPTPQDLQVDLGVDISSLSAFDLPLEASGTICIREDDLELDLDYTLTGSVTLSNARYDLHGTVPDAVPEPGTAVLLLAGLVVVGRRGKTKRGGSSAGWR